MRRMRWGFASTSATFGNRSAHIHAKAETVDTLPISAESFYRRRGLILARAQGHAAEFNLRKIQQHKLTSAEGKPTAIAVIWERSAHEGREDLLSFVVITTLSYNETGSNESRQPALIQPKDWAVWLGEAPATPAELEGVIAIDKARQIFLLIAMRQPLARHLKPVPAAVYEPTIILRRIRFQPGAFPGSVAGRTRSSR